MKKIYRYPGAKPFETTEKHIFYGRQEDAIALYQNIQLHPLVLLHAKSGMGKSSLINAGLIPLMQQDGQFSITSVRFNACTAPTDTKPLSSTRLALNSQSEVLGKIRPEGDNSLWYQLKSRQINSPKRQQQLLIFDQFEELFTYDEAAIQDFANDLSEALYSSLPQRFRERRKTGFEQKPNFLSPEALAQLDEPIQVHILMAIRSDRMSVLKKIEAYLPNILSKDYELQALERSQAEDAILSPVYQQQNKGFVTPIFDYSDEAIEYLLDFLSENDTQPIESFQLQILCEFVERILVEKQGKTLIEQADIAEPEYILENYYLDKIQEISLPQERLAARKLIEEGLIFEEEERRLSLYEGQIVNTYQISPALLLQLLDTHLIRSEPSLRGGYTYELSHDTLVAPVLKAKAKRVEKERIAWEAAEEKRRAAALKVAEEKAEKERKRAENEKKLRKKAEEAEKVAKESKLVAEQNEQRASQRSRMAIFVGCIAIALAAIAYFQFGKAKLAENKAKKQTQTALANDLAYKAQNLLKDGDRTKAFQLAAFGHRFIDSTNHQADRVIHDAFYYNDHPDRQKDSTQQIAWHQSFVGQTDTVLTASFSPDGKYVISGGRDNTLKLWSVHSRQEIKTFEGHNGNIQIANFSFDGKYILSGSRDNTLKLWSIESGDVIKTFKGHDDYIHAASFSPDDKYIISGSRDKTLKFWSVESGKLIETFKGHEEAVEAASFSPDGKYVISGGRDNTLKLWSIQSKQEIKTFKGHEKPVYSVSFSPDGRYVISSSRDKTLKLWSIESGELVKTFKGHKKSVYFVTFSPDGRYVLSASFDKTLKIWSMESGEVIKSFKRHNSHVYAISFLSDGQQVVSGSWKEGLQLWSVQNEQVIKTFKGHNDNVYAANFSPDGKYVISGSADKTLKLWSIQSGEILKTFEGHDSYILAANFSPNGEYLISGSLNHTLKLWSVQSGEVVKTFKGHDDYIYAASFSPDGEHIISGSWDKTLKLWSVQSGEVIKTFKGHDSYVYAVNFSPDGQYVISGSRDKTLKLWSVQSGQKIKTFKGHNSHIYTTNFSPDGKYLISGSWDNTLKLWSVQSGQEIKTFKGHNDNIYAANFSPDGQYVISASADKTLKLWSVQIGQEIKTFKGHISIIAATNFSPNGKHVISGSQDKTLKLWKIKSADILNSVPKLAHFSPSDIQQYSLYEILNQINQWDYFLKTADPLQVFNFGQYLQQEVEHNNNPNTYNEQLTKAIQCYTITAEAYPYYYRYVVKCYLEWGEKLLRQEYFEAAMEKVDLAAAVAPADLVEEVVELRAKIVEQRTGED